MHPLADLLVILLFLGQVDPMHGLFLSTDVCDQGLIVLGCDLLGHSFSGGLVNRLGYSRLGCRYCILQDYESQNISERIQSDGCCVYVCKVCSGFGKELYERIETVHNDMIHGAH